MTGLLFLRRVALARRPGGHPGLLPASSLVIAALASFTGCHFERVERTENREFRFDLAAGPPELDIRIDEGSVEIERSSGSELVVQFRIRARASSDEAAEALLGYMAVSAREEGLPAEAPASEGAEADSLVRTPTPATPHRIRVEARRQLSSGRFSYSSLRADVRIQLPHQAQIDVYTRDGSIELNGIRGVVTAETADGRIRLRDFQGQARLDTGDGSITGTEISGEVEAHSGDGRIQLEGAFRQLYAATGDGSLRVTCREGLPLNGSWTLRSSDGSIGLSLPDGFSARIEASTNDGRIVNELSNFEGEERDQQLIGRVGEGGELILITTLDGRITLREL